MKVAINTRHGGFFDLSDKAKAFMGISFDEADDYELLDETRSDPRLIHCIETLGEEANTSNSFLEVVEIPDGVEYEINGWDGYEYVAEKHRKWYGEAE